MQIKTERGLISVEKECHTANEAEKAGFTYAFYSNELNCKVYSKCLDIKGAYHSFALVKE